MKLGLSIAATLICVIVAVGAAATHDWCIKEMPRVHFGRKVAQQRWERDHPKPKVRTEYEIEMEIARMNGVWLKAKPEDVAQRRAELTPTKADRDALKRWETECDKEELRIAAEMPFPSTATKEMAQSVAFLGVAGALISALCVLSFVPWRTGAAGLRIKAGAITTRQWIGLWMIGVLAALVTIAIVLAVMAS